MAAELINGEVIDDETEGDVAGAVSEQARGIGALKVAVAGQVLDEADLRQAAGLWEPVHATPDFEVYEAAAHHAMELISFHNFVGDHSGADADVFVARRREGGAEVKVCDIQRSPFLFAGHDGVSALQRDYSRRCRRGDLPEYRNI
jgi:hypothetical protein